MLCLAFEIPTLLTGWPAGMVGGFALAAGAWWIARRLQPSGAVPPAPDELMAPTRTMYNTSESYRLLLEKVMATTPALIVVLDRQGRFVKFNQACIELTGFEPSEVLGKPFWESVIPLEERDTLKQNFQRLVTTMSPRPYENDWMDKQGKRHKVLWANALVRGTTDADLLVIATGIDVTESRRLQAELIHAQRMEAIGQLAGGISHDFNNLLTAIFGHIALAKRLIPKTHAASASLDRVEQAAGQAGRVIRSLLSFSTNDRSEKAPTLATTLITEIAPLIDGLLPASIQLIIEPAPADRWIKADRSLIEQALINLAINARDAMPNGGTLTLAAHAGEGDVVEITLSDTGYGIPKELLARVMEPFFTTKAPHKGAGLGLPVARSIITDHGGTLVLESEPGVGTRVTLTLPTCEPPLEVTHPIKPDSLGLLVASTRTYPRQIMTSSLGTLGVPVRAIRDLPSLELELRTGPPAAVLVADLPMLGEHSSMLELASTRGTRVLLIGSHEQCAAVESKTATTLAEPFSTTQLLAAVRALANDIATGEDAKP